MPNENPQRRTQADKERSRQQSRAVSGKEAAKGVAGKPGQGQRQTGGGRPQQGAKGPRPPGAGRGGGRRPPPKGPAGRGGAPRPRGSRAALLTWAAVGLVVVVVGVLVIVKVTGTSKGTSFTSTTLPASTTHDVTSVPESVFNTVGVSSTTISVTVPHPTKGQKALVIDGKPGFFYLGGEFCPFCAAQRWAIATSLSRFGTFTGIKTMLSSTSDIYPNTHTITFGTATYTSPYIATWLVEETSRTHAVIHPLTKAQQAVASKYDTSKYTGGSATATGGSIPFIDVGNKVLMAGASYVPSALSPGTTPLSWSDIAGGLSDPSNPVTRAIISTANYISASICSIDGAKPATVCKGKGVTEAAKTMGLKL